MNLVRPAVGSGVFNGFVLMATIVAEPIVQFAGRAEPDGGVRAIARLFAETDQKLQ